VFAFVGTERMPLARIAGQIANTRVAGAAILAFILGFLIALIQGMLSFIRAKWMAHTRVAGQICNTGIFSSTIFTVVVHVVFPVFDDFPKCVSSA